MIALNPATGKQLWAYDPKIDNRGAYGDGLINRGVIRKPIDCAVVERQALALTRT